VKCAASVAAALTLLAREPIDAIVSDIGLPDATGHDLMGHVKRIYGIPGIAISGFGMDTDIKASQDAGFTCHLTKPVDLNQLDATLRQCASAEKVAD
jgi:CheY-like chemotaxis protein